MADDDVPVDDTGPRAAVIQLERPAAGPAPEAGSGDPSSGASPVVLVDQRMRSRRVAVLRAAGQRRLRRLVWILVPIALLVDGAAVAQTHLLDVDRITVEGTEQTLPAAVAWAAEIDRGDALVTLDEPDAERRIERLPWVEEADVIREWPGTVHIAVSERVPAAAFFGADEAPPALVDREGRVLDIGGPVPFGVIAVTDLDATLREGAMLPASAMDALDLGVRLNEQLPGVAASVDIDLDATLNRGGIARFGSADELEDKLVALNAFLSDVDLGDLAILDLRVPDNPTVRRS
ncbi:MAG: cell division protein FtsQ/DivIB [Acidimicrobiales bacterium]